MAIDGFVLESVWTAADGAARGTYRLTLINRTALPLHGFRLGLSGPARIGDNAEIAGGQMVSSLSNFCELAPDSGLELQPGESWSVDVDRPEFPIGHWTDGTTSGYVIHADGTTTPALTVPTRLAGSDTAARRGTMRLPVSTAAVSLATIPWPSHVAVNGRRTVPAGFALRGDNEAAEQVADDFSALTQFLFPGEGIVRDEEEGGYPVDCKLDRNLRAEAYEIDFEPDRATVTGGDERGLLYGLVTLGQIQRGARLQPLAFSFPATGHIEDAPLHGWRGCHLDVARRFYSSEEIKQFLAILAWNKLNVFHWHLSDDEGWRVEINALPKLTEVGAWRGHGLPIPPLLGSGPEPTGGYYTQDAVREIVALGEAFGVEIIPEIDLPGHCYALLQALPQLRDPGETGIYHSIQGFPNNCLNPAMDVVYPVLETILSELMDLFPSRYFHLGADEVPESAWSGSPQARALLERLGAGDAAALQAHFLKRLQRFLTSHGKITGAWEEAAAGGGIDREHCYLVGWRTAAAARELAAAGYQVVAAPAQAYYLDMANGADWHECGAAWAGWSSPEATYRFDPVEGWDADEKARLMGVQACIWSEPMTDRAVFDRLVFPRLSAIAETAWTQPTDRDYARFSAIAGLMPNLYKCHEEV